MYFWSAVFIARVLNVVASKNSSMMKSLSIFLNCSRSISMFQHTFSVKTLKVSSCSSECVSVTIKPREISGTCSGMSAVDRTPTKLKKGQWYFKRIENFRIAIWGVAIVSRWSSAPGYILAFLSKWWARMFSLSVYSDIAYDSSEKNWRGESQSKLVELSARSETALYWKLLRNETTGEEVRCLKMSWWILR